MFAGFEKVFAFAYFPPLQELRLRLFCPQIATTSRTKQGADAPGLTRLRTQILLLE